VIRNIAGRQNHSIKLARKLQRKNFRRERGLLVGEGMDLLAAALAGGADVREILVRHELVTALPAGLRERAAASAGPAHPAGARGAAPRDEDAVSEGLDIGICDQETLDYASSLGGSADVIFICIEPAGRLADVDLSGGLAFYLDGLGDPGNVGTLIRTAVAFGLAGVICSPGTADPWGPKALRGGMGAQFSIALVTEVGPGDLQARFAALAAKGHAVPRVLVADSRGGRDIREVTAAGAAAETGGMVLVLGSERTGPVAQWQQAERVTIPQRRFDSLNVAMAGTVLAYELGRGRQ
jgi:RNA methyltransferase, TrmH family